MSNDKQKTPVDVKRLYHSEAVEKELRKKYIAARQAYNKATDAKGKAEANAKMDFYNAKILVEQSRRKMISAKHY